MKKIITLAALICSVSLLAIEQNSLDTISADSLKTINLQEVVATGSRLPVEQQLLPLTVSVVNQEELELRHEPSIMPTLTEQVPGLFITQRGVLGYGVSTGGSGGIKVRGIGGSPNTDILVLIDGLPQYAGLYGHPIADNYQTFLAQRVEVIRGPASLLYGSNAMGGVVNIVTRQPQSDTIITNINLQGGSYYTLNTSINNQVRKGKFSSAVGFNYSRTDGHRENMEFDEYNAFLRLGYDINQQWKLSAMGNIAYFNSSNPGPISNPIEDNDMHILRGVASISAENHYERSSGAIRLYYNAGKHQIDDGYRPLSGASPQMQLYFHTDLMAGLSAYETFNFFKGNHTTFGFDYQHFGGHAWNRIKASGKETDIIRRTQFDLAGYIDFRQQILSWFNLDAGLRIDWMSSAATAVPQFIPQAGLSFILPKEAEIKALASRGFRNPTIRELYMYAPANDELLPENLWNFEISYRQHLLDNRISLGANIFYLQAKNMIETRIVDGKNRNVNTGEQHNAGVEVDFSALIIKGLRLNANYSYLYTKEPVLAAPEHKLNIALNYHHDRFRVGTSLQYINGLTTLLPTDKSEAKKQNYALWNAHISYRIWKELWANLKADNLLGQEYEINAGFPMPRTTLLGGLSWTF